MSKPEDIAYATVRIKVWPSSCSGASHEYVLDVCRQEGMTIENPREQDPRQPFRGTIGVAGLRALRLHRYALAVEIVGGVYHPDNRLPEPQSTPGWAWIILLLLFAALLCVVSRG